MFELSVERPITLIVGVPLKVTIQFLQLLNICCHCCRLCPLQAFGFDSTDKSICIACKKQFLLQVYIQSLLGLDPMSLPQTGRGRKGLLK